MPKRPRQQRRAPDEADLETDVPPDALRDDLPRRRDQPPTPPDSITPRDGEVPVGGGFTPTPDGGNEQHPIHDEEFRKRYVERLRARDRPVGWCRAAALTKRSKFYMPG